jgi:CelD/BcsL family acetyltransferase involved in cellulose biosynthesis
MPRTGAVAVSPEVELATLSNVEDLVQLGPQWDELVRAMPRPSPFLLSAWLAWWWRLYGEDGELAIHVARRGDRLVGGLPLHVRRTHGLRVAEFLGGGHSHLADVLVADREADTAGALAERLAASRLDFVELFGLPGESRLAAALGAGRLRVQLRVEAPVLDLAGRWEDIYAEKMSAKTRSGHRRKWRRLEDLGEVSVRQAEEPDDVAAALVEGLRLHALRWEGRNDRSGLTDERGRTLMRSGYGALAEHGVARVLLLELDGRAIAFNAYLELGGVLYSHRLAYDPAFAPFSPGLLCTLRMLELAAANGIRRVEWLGGTEDYKLQLMDRFDPMYEGVGLAGTPRGRVVAATRLASTRLRRALKRSATLRRLYLRLPATASA